MVTLECLKFDIVNLATTKLLLSGCSRDVCIAVKLF